MAVESDPSWLTNAVAGLGAAVTALATWAWKHTHKRIDDVNNKTDTFLTNESFLQHIKTRDDRLSHIDHALEKHEAVVGKLFEKLDEVADRTEVRFTVTEKENRLRHDTLVQGQTQILVALESLKK